MVITILISITLFQIRQRNMKRIATSPSTSNHINTEVDFASPIKIVLTKLH